MGTEKEMEKPRIIIDGDVQEGVYSASGAEASCLAGSAAIESTPDDGYANYSIRLNAAHNGDHKVKRLRVILSFNQAVTYVQNFGGGAPEGETSGTTVLMLVYTMGYPVQKKDNAGLGTVQVESASGLAITGCEMQELELA